MKAGATAPTTASISASDTSSELVTGRHKTGRYARPAGSLPLPGGRLLAKCVFGFSLAFASFAAETSAEEVYQSPQDYLVEAFGADVPAPRNLWLRGGLRKDIKNIIGHRYGGLRIKYWRRGKRTVWILEEIGKYKPITTGFTVDNEEISYIKILIYRESHGWDDRHPFFTDQFKRIRLRENNKLTKGIDNISGAPLSVNAIRRLARLALFLNRRTMADDTP